ncbi:MAG: stalk domain-containing protein [Armatimonadota bacterium]
MRYLLLGLWCILAGGAMAQQPAPPTSPSPPIYTALVTDVSPELRAGRTFVPIRVISEQFGATVRWMPETQSVEIRRQNQPTITLVINSRLAHVGDQNVTLDAAPFISLNRTMVPLRFIAESYGVPISYNAQTNSVFLPRGDRIYILPLQSTRTGIYIADPKPSMLVRNPILVQGQGNVFEGHLNIEVRDSRGRVLGSTFATAGMGGFYPFSTRIYYNLPSEDAADGSIVVYSINGKGDGKVLARAAVRVRLASTI